MLQFISHQNNFLSHLFALIMDNFALQVKPKKFLLKNIVQFAHNYGFLTHNSPKIVHNMLENNA